MKRKIIDPAELTRLWRLGYSDYEIAERLGFGAKSICRVRNALGLPVVGNMKMYRGRNGNGRSLNFSDKTGVPMATALAPEQCLIVRDFLHDLIGVYRQKCPGMTVNLASFMREWRRNVA